MTLSTSFLGPFSWRGKGKGPGTKVEHTVTYVLGQYSRRHRASFILQANVKNILKRTLRDWSKSIEGGGWEHLEMWWIKTTCPIPALRFGPKLIDPPFNES